MALPASPVETDATAARVRREFGQLAVLCAAACALFWVTRELAHANDVSRQGDAVTWYARGLQGLESGASVTAVESFRHAVALDGTRAEYHLALADALLRANRDSDAQAVLAARRQVDPESAEVNVRLARLSVRSGQRDEAVRYYEMALAALWPESSSTERRAIRLELTEFMLRENLRSRALAELLILTADAPITVDDRLVLGRLFLAAGDPRRAAERFAEALTQSPANPNALAGAGEAAFALGDYTRALRFFNALPAGIASRDGHREIAQRVIERDPLAPRLGASARASRLRRSADELIAELDQCGVRLATGQRASDALVDARVALLPLSSLAPRTRSAPTSRDDVEEGLGLLLAGVHAMRAASCGEPSMTGQAIERIAAVHELVEP